mgnify:CR=1 FL=1
MRPADEVLGAVGFSVLAVRPGDTCVTMGVSDLPVVAPSIYLSLMESACVAALSEYLKLKPNAGDAKIIETLVK